MTFGYTLAIRRTMAMRVAVNGMALLIASLFVGSYVLDFFGISIGAVQMGGGLGGDDLGLADPEPAEQRFRPEPGRAA